jgi:pyrimidine-nucleoside phosphorylase
MPDPERAQKLARAMIQLGEDRGTPVVALLTAMDRPLGCACGNALEVKESLDALRGSGPDDLMEVTYALGAEMLMLAGAASNAGDAWTMMKKAIDSGKALDKFREIIEAQGGDASIIDNQDVLASAPVTAEFTAERDGIVQEVAPRAIGHGVIALRGGRRTMEDRIDPSVGFIIITDPGKTVKKGDVLATIHALDEPGVKEGKKALKEAITIGDEAAKSLPLISVKITGNGTEQWIRPAAIEDSTTKK